MSHSIVLMDNDGPFGRCERVLVQSKSFTTGKPNAAIVSYLHQSNSMLYKDVTSLALQGLSKLFSDTWREGVE